MHALGSAGGVALAATNMAVTTTLNTRTVPLHDVLEISFQHDGHYANPFFDVTLDVALLISPDGAPDISPS